MCVVSTYQLKKFAVYCITTVAIFLLAITYRFSLVEKRVDDLEQQCQTLSKTLAEIEQERNQNTVTMEANLTYLEKQFSEVKATLEQLEKYKLKAELDAIESQKDSDPKGYITEYKRIASEYPEWMSALDDIKNVHSPADIYYLEKMVQTETNGADFNSKVNVANVALNRVAHEEWPNTLAEVITQKNQFAYGKDNITEDTKLACEYALMFDDTTNGALAFRSDACPETFGKYSYYFTDEVGHNFYGE